MMNSDPPTGHPGERISRAFRLTRRGFLLLFAAALAFVFAYVIGWYELLIVGSFACIPPLLSLVVVHRMRPQFTVVRTIAPSVLAAGKPGAVRLTVRNVGQRPSAAGSWRDRVPWSPDATAAATLDPMQPSGQLHLRYEFVPPRRGIVEVGPLLVSFTDPFGLAEGQFAVGTADRVIIGPEAARLDETVVEIAADSGSARLFQHRSLAGEHDIMTREYRPGDAMRRVHWRASAHHGELMVREEEKRSHAAAVIVLETRVRHYADTAGSRARIPESGAFEWAVRMTASLRDHLSAAGLALNVVETAMPQLSDPDRLDEFVESLARVHLSFDDDRELSLGAGSPSGAGSIFAVLGVPDAATLGTLVGARGSFDEAAAFVSEHTPPAAIDELRRGGWRVVAVTPETPVADAWHDLGGPDA